MAGGDPALSAMAYRDALDRASRLRDPHELGGLLERAEATGDAALAKAVLYRGYQLQSAGLV